MSGKNVKQECYIDVYDTEIGGQYYMIKTRLGDDVPDCANYGVFLDSYEVDEFIAENSDMIEIVKDYREGWA